MDFKMKINKCLFALVFFSMVTVLHSSCTNGKWESFGSYGEKNWPLSITNGSEKYEFNYSHNTVIHYFDEQNAEKIWFKRFKNPQKDVLKSRNVLKVQKYLDDGWTYSDETRGEQQWPWFISKGVEKYVFDYDNNAVVHYFDPDNAEKLWFSSFQNPQEDALEQRNVTRKVEKYIVDGWQYSGSYGDGNWPLSISKDNEKYEFDYPNGSAIHYFDNENAERLQFSSFQNPMEDVLQKRNLVGVERSVVQGWHIDTNKTKNGWPYTMTKMDKTIKFDYQNKTATLFIGNEQSTKTWFSSFNDPVLDMLESHNVVYIKRDVDGWKSSGSYGKYEFPLSMSKGNERYEFDYNNKTATKFINGLENSKIWFKSFQDPQRDVLELRNVIYVKKPAEGGWTYKGSYGKYEYPTSMTKGNEKYEFDFKNGITAYHFVNGRRTEALEFNSFQSPMDVVNRRNEAKIREYQFDYEGKLYRVKYFSKYGTYYLPFRIGVEGKEEIGGTSIYKKGTGLVDDVVIEASLESKSSLFDMLFSSDVYVVYQIDKGTGTKNKIAEVSPNQLKAYLLNILYNLEGSYDNQSHNQGSDRSSSYSTNEDRCQNEVYLNENKSSSEDASQVAYQWTRYHNTGDAYELASLYANQVNYYQSTYTRDQIRASKEKLLNKYPEFRQEISNISVEKSSDCYRISFDKKVWTDLNKAPKTYPSYLEVKLSDGAWAIITESDRVTDENLRKKNK